MRNTLIAATLAILLCSGAAEATNEPPSDSIQSATAQQLYSDYQKNEVAADLQYKGKLVRVSGSISRIGVDVLGDPFVVLAVSTQFSGVQLVFDKEWTKELAKLHVRDQINAQLCVGAGMVVENPILNCSLPAIRGVQVAANASAQNDQYADDSLMSSNAVSITEGQCRTSTILKISHRLESNGAPMVGSGSAVNLANGLYLVSYEESKIIQDSKIGDPVIACMVQTEKSCPANRPSSDGYVLINTRTHGFWSASTSEHSCRGA
ncbi:MAG: OB-fold putative lipoprotein [Castellaniella sp.]|nr:OB-fold putative lipoprotein [Castellaniella sp.]